jgi:hypothetical protein
VKSVFDNRQRIQLSYLMAYLVKIPDGDISAIARSSDSDGSLFDVIDALQQEVKTTSNYKPTKQTLGIVARQFIASKDIEKQAIAGILIQALNARG